MFVLFQSTIQILNTCPYFIRQICKAILMGMNMKALSRISAYTYLWGNTNPLILMVNSVVPGLIYFNSTGLMTHVILHKFQFYDSSARYRLTLGTSDADKFQVKTVKRFQGNNSMTSQTMVENTHSYNNSYEGAAFPPQMTPETPISIYRYGICKTLSMRYIGTKQMDYGSEAFVYGFDNTTFNDHKLCDSKGWSCKLDLPWRGHDAVLVDHLQYYHGGP
ncbi:Scavenger receptor class B type 1 like protein 11 [Operophtera brumata]|uniref:Scavenger receptor class B member 1 n=1 Tax=Operophtera brumata TaxID=104452 RepID=A0A0L7KYG8_OPEBR|nr:Scavenger receptor class B type 1 like protein 11 [Operophtera brumata]